MGQDHCDHDPMQTSFTTHVCSHLAAYEDHRATATQPSQDNDADIDAGLGYNLMYLLYWALSRDQLRATEGLSEGLEIDIDCCDRFGYAPLTLAAYRGSCHVARNLLASEAEFSAQDTNGLTALHIAACEGDMLVVELLLQHPEVDVNAQDTDGLTALHIAAGEGHMLVVELLLQHPEVDVNAQDTDGLTALHIAAGEGHMPVVELLLQHPRVDVNVQDTDGLTALHIAAGEEYSPIVELLLQKPKLDVNTQDIEGLAALHDAAYEGRLLSLKLLLQHTGIIVNKQDKCGLTALHKAANKGHLPTVELLLQHPEMDVNVRDTRGRTPLWWAVVHQPEVASRLLDDTRIAVNIMDGQGSSYLHLAVQTSNNSLVNKLLARYDIDPNLEDESGRTALSYAKENGDISIWCCLLGDPRLNTNNNCDHVPSRLIQCQRHRINAPGRKKKKILGLLVTPYLFIVIRRLCSRFCILE
ncbi:ankyrin repeat domain-containing protein 50 [Aspergillus awamori]|uniref:Ankyrin repeat domain-containing protein 50 n=2 Tax=Aspergillus TaxID=5052 RepID=A0A401KYZ1_ASPAW|nr:ankyrin repeat domain-containing protein 50 [Aspergillus awamori]GCB28302.1 ankyrin repeat domain-containing protein 50 [Aspergillus awamori]